MPRRNRPEVFVSNEQDAVEIEPSRWQELAVAVLNGEGVKPNSELALIFVDEEVISDLNLRFMGKQGPTDVLSFPIAQEEADGGRTPDGGTSGPDNGFSGSMEPEILLGDIIICPSVAETNSAEREGDRGHRGTLDDELALLVVHGILHLRGMDHIDDAEAEAMEALEDTYLRSYYFESES